MLMGHLALRGNAFNQMLFNGRGQITALMPLHPDRMQVELLAGGDYRYRYTDGGGQVITYAREQIWHLRGLSGDGLLGYSPIDIARESIGLAMAAQSYGARFFVNDAKPTGGWIEFSGQFKDADARRMFRESLMDAQSSINRGKIAVLDQGMKYHEVGVTNNDAQFLETRQFQVGEIARLFRVPPHLIGDLSKATFSNIEQQSLDFVMHTMTPWAERWEASIEAQLLLDDEPIEVEHDFTRLLRGDAASRSAYYHNGIMDGWMTRNEARRSEKLPPLPGLDQPLYPLNMTTGAPAQDDDA
jgi:HK97 family phage portal protein